MSAPQGHAAPGHSEDRLGLPPERPRIRGRRRGRGTERRRDESLMVPDVEFTSYYGRNVVKPSPWEAHIPTYLFLGGVAAGSSLLGAGADLTGRAALCRAARVSAVAALGGTMYALVDDLGRPSRFLNMLRVAKPTSPMSMGTWILFGYGPLAGLAAAAEVTTLLPGPLRRLGPLLSAVGRPAGIGAAVFAPALASYTAVLLADTATPAWHETWRELPFVFCGSAAAASGGLAMITSPLAQAAPARRMALGGAVVDLVADQRMRTSMGYAAGALESGPAAPLHRAASILTAAGALGSALLGRRNRAAAVLSGVALLAGSACTRFAMFEAGQASARDPAYTIVPQRERLAAPDASR